jgi:hypothetical protein
MKRYRKQRSIELYFLHQQQQPSAQPLSVSSPTVESSTQSITMTSLQKKSQDSCRCFHDITPGLTQTRRGLRSFINTNAARLCNLAIRSPFPLEAELLETKFSGSWPVVGHQGLPGPLPGIESNYASDRSYIAQTRLPRTLQLSRIH